MVAWKLTTDFDAERHLFFEKIETDYVVETYVCSCGVTDFITKHSNQKMTYICPACENSTFYSAKSAWKNIDHFIEQYRDLDLMFTYSVNHTEVSVVSHYYVAIPKAIDYLKKEVYYAQKDVHTYTLNADGTFVENYLLRFSPTVVTQLKNNLQTYLNKHNCFGIPKSKEKSLTLKMVSFFFKNRNLKDLDFYYWRSVEMIQGEEVDVPSALQIISRYPKAKSVKKGVYQNYVDQFRAYGNYDATFVELFCEVIEDTNILTKLLALDLHETQAYIREKEGLVSLVRFLKQHYSEKQILKLFTSLTRDNRILFQDLVSEYQYQVESVETLFQKVSCHVQTLHDEFVRCAREKQNQKIVHEKLQYGKEAVLPCVEVDGYQVQLPHSGKALLSWADILHNCMAGYFDMINKSETYIYGFFQEKCLCFAVEISGGKLIQASGKHNAHLSKEQKEVCGAWLKRFFNHKENLDFNNRDFVNVDDYHPAPVPYVEVAYGTYVD